MALDHPDPEGHLTDLTISALRDLRDTVLKDLSTSVQGEWGDGWDDALKYYLPVLNNILEPWGEGPIAEDGN